MKIAKLTLSLICFFLMSSSFAQDGKIFDKVEKSAHPIGGYASFYSHILENTPCKDDLTPTSIISFVIEVDGTLSNAKIVGGFSDTCGATLLAFLKSSGKWIPAKNAGETVRQRVKIPIRHK